MRKILVAFGALTLLAMPPAFAQTDTETTGGEGAAVGAAGGAIAGAVAGGPIGAIIGAAAGAVVGTAIDPPEPVQAYVIEQDVPSVTLTGDLVVGACLPEVVQLYDVPESEYDFAVVNDRRVLVDPNTRCVVHLFD